jgi:DNA-binding MarR family transcriptional regulator
MEEISQILREIQRCNRAYRENQLEPLGLTTRHGWFLREVGQNPGISQEQLSQKLCLNKSNVARQSAAMEEEGYILRKPCGKDKRVLRLYLTEKAQALLPEIQRITDRWEQLLTRELTESEAQILNILLPRLLTNAQTAVEEGNP